MSATETMSAVLPPQPPDVIDVDAFEDDDVVFSGFARTNLHFHPTGMRNLDEEGLVYMGFSASSSSRPPARRSHPTDSAQAGSSTSTRAEEVIVLDSDDEDGPSSSAASAGSSSVRSRLNSLPPPPPLRGLTPAVPSLPPHLASQASLPARRRPPGVAAAPPPPVIRPSDQPLPFESRMASLPRLPPRNPSVPAPAPAPRSHHQPAMGFGGALLALNRQNSIAETNRQQRAEARTHFNIPSFTEIYRRISSYRGNSNGLEDTAGVGGLRRWQRFWPWTNEDAPQDAGRALSPFGDEDAWFPDIEFEFRHRIKVPEKPVHYKPAYTHPDKAAPGFTHDFAPVDSPPLRESPPLEAGPSNAASSSSSATAIETTLVCGRCLDPMVLAAHEGASEEVRKKYRVWALRCGHMLDGKCIADLVTPPPPVPVEPPVEEYAGKGKGKARADPEVSSAHPEPCQDAQPADFVAAPSTTDRKGKRKAVEPLEPDEPPKRPTLMDSPAEDNSIRSRLRSRARAAADVTPPDLDEGSSSAPMPEPSSRQRGGRRRGRGPPGIPAAEFDAASSAKGKGKARARAPAKPVIEAEHIWRCPIAGCGCLHYSVLVEGEWRNDEGRGAIALFV
ncbi:hypothetical protein C8T65DRAFT_573498 [Cerioporus squamosus]|nr:hypothetical protein C8T65DRAFT_573498 [Cerioporus squamosus]